jgi:type I restriction enzyme, R subunit
VLPGLFFASRACHSTRLVVDVSSLNLQARYRAHVAYAMPPLTREERAAKAKVAIDGRFNTKQQIFLDFVLSHYVSMGVDELDQEKLTPLLRLKYHNSIADAVADLAKPEEISNVFTGFQKFLYQEGAHI